MFPDTITITIDSAEKVLTRINQDGYSSEYHLIGNDDEFRLRLRNTSYTDKARGGRKIDRHNVELVQEVYPTDGAIYPVIRKFYSILERDTGDSVALSLEFALGVLAFHTEANVTKLLNRES